MNVTSRFVELVRAARGTAAAYTGAGTRSPAWMNLAMAWACPASFASAVASRMLRAWNVEVSKFRKVMPTDYKRVLAVIEQAEADGLSETETTNRIMESARA